MMLHPVPRNMMLHPFPRNMMLHPVPPLKEFIFY